MRVGIGPERAARGSRQPLGLAVPGPGRHAATRPIAAPLVSFATALAFVVSLAPAQAHADGVDEVEKHDYPVVVDHLIQEDSDSLWRSEGDFAQGQDIPFCVVSTLPENIEEHSDIPYWLRVRTDTTFAMQDGTIRVELNHADGSSADVTNSLSVGFSGNIITAGANDLDAALPGLRADDTFVLYYTMRFADTYRYGYGNGNSNYAYLLYDGTSYVDDDPAEQAGLATASMDAAAPSRSPAFPSLLPARAYAAEEGPGADLLSSPEVKVTAYTYSIDIVKQSETDARPIAGAAFAVRDEEGRWYVRGKSWEEDRDDATVFTTGDDGLIRFIGLDANRYEIVEVAAPRHYLAIDPVDVLIESDVAGQDDALRVTSAAATVAKADAAEGTIVLALQDPEDPADPPPGREEPGGDPGNTPGRSSPSGFVPQLGEMLPIVGWGLFSLFVVLVAVIGRRRASSRRGKEDGR